MTINELVINSLSSLNVDVVPDQFVDNSSEFIYFVIEDERAESYADDTPDSLTYWLQIHYFVPCNSNYINRKKEIKNLLFKSGFSYPTIGMNTVENDTNLRHICFKTTYVADTDIESEE